MDVVKNGSGHPMGAIRIYLCSQQLLRVLLRQTVFLQESPLQKYCWGDYFLAKYIFSLQFSILISQQNYSLQTRDITCKCLYVLQEVRSITVSSYIIVSAKFCNISFLNNFYFVSFFHHLFICQCQRKIRLVTLSKSCLHTFFF